jgi:hypothetical protein
MEGVAIFWKRSETFFPKLLLIFSTILLRGGKGLRRYDFSRILPNIFCVMDVFANSLKLKKAMKHHRTVLKDEPLLNTSTMEISIQQANDEIMASIMKHIEEFQHPLRNFLSLFNLNELRTSSPLGASSWMANNNNIFLHFTDFSKIVVFIEKNMFPLVHKSLSPFLVGLIK